MFKAIKRLFNRQKPNYRQIILQYLQESSPERLYGLYNSGLVSVCGDGTVQDYYKETTTVLISEIDKEELIKEATIGLIGFDNVDFDNFIFNTEK